MKDKQKTLSVSDIFLAAFSSAFLALGIFEALKVNKETIKEISPIWIILAFGAFVIWAIVKALFYSLENRKERKKWEQEQARSAGYDSYANYMRASVGKRKREEEETARSAGYESYAEYMAENEFNSEDIRAHWAASAQVERAKRKLRKLIRFER